MTQPEQTPDDRCEARRDLGHGVVLSCDKRRAHGGEHREHDDLGRRTFWR